MANNRSNSRSPANTFSPNRPLEEMNGATRERGERAAEPTCYARQQQSIAALSRMALERDDLAALMGEGVRHVSRELGVEYAQISEFSARDQSFVFRAGAGWLLERLGAEELASALAPQLAFTVAAGEPVIVSDLSTERRFSASLALRAAGARSSMSVVIPGYPQVFGVLVVYGRAQRDFTAADSMFLRAIANVLAGAIQNDHSKRALQDRGARMAAVIDTSLEGIITIDERGIIESLRCPPDGSAVEETTRSTCRADSHPGPGPHRRDL